VSCCARLNNKVVRLSHPIFFSFVCECALVARMKGLINALSERTDVYSDLSEENQKILENERPEFQHLKTFPEPPADFSEDVNYGDTFPSIEVLVEGCKESDLQLIKQFHGLGLAVGNGSSVLTPDQFVGVYIGEV
jgi:hypothetical protein